MRSCRCAMSPKASSSWRASTRPVGLWGLTSEQDPGLCGQGGGRLHVERPPVAVVDDRRGEEAAPHLFDGLGERRVGGGEEEDTVAGRGGEVHQDLDHLDQVEEDPQPAGAGAQA